MQNLTWHEGQVTREDREELLGQRGCVVWITGLSGAGKSTVARALEAALVNHDCLAYVLDGDNVRYRLNSDLAFSPEDRTENIRRIGEVAALFADAGLIVIAAFISPYHEDRERARLACGADRFVEVFLDVPVAVCEARDPKQLYRKARAGSITGFTGIDAPYEIPDDPSIRLDTEDLTVQQCVGELMDYLRQHHFIDADICAEQLRRGEVKP